MTDGLEYLNLYEDDIQIGGQNAGPRLGALPDRGWSERLCYGTGTVYLAGLSTGGAWGFIEGMRHPEGRTFKLRLNSVLNACTRRGPFLGNSAGVLALTYNVWDSLIGHFYGKRDTTSSVASGALTGALFKSTAGVRPALVAAAMMGGMMAAWNFALAAYADRKADFEDCNNSK
ncbi:Tim17-domain-containing protein [Ramicandelaber brevisporus]|nr:Tim17-domain-containing protein [Ramicandelaber brevisporus]